MKKVILLICLALLSIIFISCNKDDEYLELTNLRESQIFTQEADSYYIYFHRDNCSGCETVKTQVLHYNYLTSKNDELVKIYGLNLEKEGQSKSYIYRTYEGEEGQGDKGTFYVDGVTEWNDLYIPGTPGLIKIETIDGVKTAKFVCQGASKIGSYLGDLG